MFTGAVAGLADQPLQVLMSTSEAGEIEEGAGRTTRKVVGGVSRALVGAVTKPIGGVAELVSQTGLGLLHGTGLVTLPQHRRLPVIAAVSGGTNSITKYTE